MIKKLIEWIKNLNPRVIHATYSHEILSVQYSNDKEIQYLGSGTVWRKMPSMKRCGTPLESMLCGLYTYIKHYGGAYPEAHKK